MRVCLITNEVFGLGRYGGFGKLTQMMAEHLVGKGVEVFVVSWRCSGQREVENVNGVHVLSFPYNPFNSVKYLPSHFYSYVQSLSLYRTVDADIYHSIELQTSTYIAQKAMPSRKHVVWFQDPYDEKAYRQMSMVDREYNWNTFMKGRFYSTLSILRMACNKSDQLYTQARFFIPIIKRLYQPKMDISYLPNPVEIPREKPKKSSVPMVCFLGRWDPQKRIEMFLQLVQRLPKVKFIAMGKANENKILDAQLRRDYQKVRNLELPGFVSEAEKKRILSQSWVLVNTSIREGLPVSFLEALAYRTAILSYVDPDGLANRFGYHVKEDSLNCFEEGLKKLLENDLWKEKAERGYTYVKENHEVNKIINKWVETYKKLL